MGAVVALGALAAALTAGDAVPVESVRPVSGLGEVSEELTSLKGAQQAGEARLGPGAIEMPKLHQPADEQTGQRRRTPDGRDPRGTLPPKTGNWLVDGVAREKALAEKAGRAPRDSRSSERESRGLDSLAGETGPEGDEAESSGDASGLEPGTVTAGEGTDGLVDAPAPQDPVALPEAAGPNPLADFLSDWLSPGDHDLLRSTLEPSAVSGGTDRPGPVTIESANPVIAAFGARGRMETGNRDARPADNPFLAFLQPAETDGPAAAAAAPLPAPAPEPLPPPAQLEPPRTRSRTPDFVRPLQDEKYYKPLKRF